MSWTQSHQTNTVTSQPYRSNSKTVSPILADQPVTLHPRSKYWCCVCTPVECDCCELCTTICYDCHCEICDSCDCCPK